MKRKLSISLALGTVFTLLNLCFILLTSFSSEKRNNPAPGIFVDKVQGQKAFALLNKVRQDPNSYSERFGASLRGIAPRPPLQWNDSLAAVAERRAMNMAYRGYFAYVDPDGNGINYYINKSYPLADDQLTDKKQSNLEAIEGEAPSGEVAIKFICVGTDKLGDEGRKLILGEGDYNGSLTDVGIAYVHGTGSTLKKSYTCIIIAKRK